MSVGKRMKDLRRESKRTLREQSEIFDVSLNSVYRWEHDLVKPKKSLLRKMADFYGVSFDWLINGDGPKENSNFSMSIHHDSSNERQLLRMFRNLPGNSKYKILGYVERICVEDMDEPVAM